jgi:hypothetical protein
MPSELHLLIEGLSGHKAYSPLFFDDHEQRREAIRGIPRGDCPTAGVLADLLREVLSLRSRERRLGYQREDRYPFFLGGFLSGRVCDVTLIAFSVGNQENHPTRSIRISRSA